MAENPSTKTPWRCLFISVQGGDDMLDRIGELGILDGPTNRAKVAELSDEYGIHSKLVSIVAELSKVGDVYVDTATNSGVLIVNINADAVDAAYTLPHVDYVVALGQEAEPRGEKYTGSLSVKQVEMLSLPKQMRQQLDLTRGSEKLVRADA